MFLVAIVIVCKQIKINIDFHGYLCQLRYIISSKTILVQLLSRSQHGRFRTRRVWECQRNTQRYAKKAINQVGLNRPLMNILQEYPPQNFHVIFNFPHTTNCVLQKSRIAGKRYVSKPYFDFPQNYLLVIFHVLNPMQLKLKTEERKLVVTCTSSFERSVLFSK